MADDATLKIHIVSDADNTGFKSVASAGADLKAGTNELGKATDDLTQSLPEGADLWNKYKNVLGATGDASDVFNTKGREMKKVLVALDQVVPGLGQSIEGLHKTIVGAGGGFVVFQLAIQAAQVYWQIYQQAVDDAMNRQAEVFDKARKALHEALTEQNSFTAELQKAAEPADRFSDALANVNAVIDAQTEARKKLLAAQKATELANAQSAVERAAIEEKYSGLASSTDAGAAQSHIQAIANVMAAIQSEIKSDTAERSRLTAEREAASKANNIDKVNALNGKIDDLDKRIFSDTGKLANYERQHRQASNVEGINQAGRNAAEMPELLNNAEAIAKRGAQNKSEQIFMVRMAQLASGQALNLQQAEAYLQNLQKHPEMMERVFDRLAHYQQALIDRLLNLERQIVAMQRTGTR